MAMHYDRLVRLYEGARSEEQIAEVNLGVRNAFGADRHLRQNFDLGRLFAECFGWHNFSACRSGSTAAQQVMLEAAGAVSTAAFQNISGQFMYQTVMAGYAQEEFKFAALIPEAPASTLDGEKIPGISEIGDEIAIRPEEHPYALAGVTEDWVFTPAIPDRGLIVPVTWEAVFNDKTGRLMERCQNVGLAAGINKEKRAIDCIIDENAGAVVGGHRYNWRGTTIASYGDNSGTHSWDNLAASNALVDWTDLDVAEQVFNAIFDPYTNEPVPWDPKHLIFAKELEQTAHHILRSTTIYRATPGWAVSANPNLNEVANPYLNKYLPVTSRHVAPRLATDTDWFLGDVGQYAKCMMAEKMDVVAAPSNSQDDFMRRIVAQYRVNERYSFVVVQPRAMVKSKVAA